LPLAQALVQVREDLQSLAGAVAPAHVWTRPGGAASVGFHVRHLGAALDRLFTYARGDRLSDLQKTALKAEGAPGDTPPAIESLVAETTAHIDRGLAQLRSTPADRLLDERLVGRAGLPSTVLGLLFHGTEHATRHAGQALTTARILADSPAP
jgi:hypothetical protein